MHYISQYLYVNRVRLQLQGQVQKPITNQGPAPNNVLQSNLQPQIIITNTTTNTTNTTARAAVSASAENASKVVIYIYIYPYPWEEERAYGDHLLYISFIIFLFLKCVKMRYDLNKCICVCICESVLFFLLLLLWWLFTDVDDQPPNFQQQQTVVLFSQVRKDYMKRHPWHLSWFHISHSKNKHIVDEMIENREDLK